MIDIKFIRQNPEKVKEGLRKREMTTEIVDQVLAVDKKRREIITELEEILEKKNKASMIIIGTKNETEKKKIIGEMKKLDLQSDILKKEIKEIQKQLDSLVQLIPNIPADDVPVGKDESENVVLRKVGEPPKFDFEPKDHVQIGKDLDLIDIERAAKVSGSRFAYLKKEAALLEMALVQMTFEMLVKKGFIPVIPPVMIKPEPYMGMGRLAGAQLEERYYLPKDDLYLVGSAEHTIGPMHMNEILGEKSLPLRYVGFSSCFRREAGSYGKDTKGILRVHQFDKVEMFSFTKPEESNKEHLFLLEMQEKLLQALKLPYQVVSICTGDMGLTDAKQYDIETWLPGQKKYRETHSCSNTTDFQARGINCRYRRSSDNKVEFVHMLNATALAIGRTIIAILENYQQKDGSVIVPKVLHKWTGFDRIPSH